MAGQSHELSAQLAASVIEASSGRPVVIALGGGADSAVLLLVASEALPPDCVRAVFVHHGLDGSDVNGVFIREPGQVLIKYD